MSIIKYIIFLIFFNNNCDIDIFNLKDIGIASLFGVICGTVIYVYEEYEVYRIKKFIKKQFILRDIFFSNKLKNNNIDEISHVAFDINEINHDSLNVICSAEIKKPDVIFDSIVKNSPISPLAWGVLCAVLSFACLKS